MTCSCGSPCRRRMRTAHAPGDVARVEVYAITADRAPHVDRRSREAATSFRRSSRTEQVRQAVPPLPPPKPGEPEPLPLPPGARRRPGRADRRPRDGSHRRRKSRVTLPRARRLRRRLPETAPLPGPLVAPDSTGARCAITTPSRSAANGRYGRRAKLPAGAARVDEQRSGGPEGHVRRDSADHHAGQPPPDARGVARRQPSQAAAVADRSVSRAAADHLRRVRGRTRCRPADARRPTHADRAARLRRLAELECHSAAHHVRDGALFRGAPRGYRQRLHVRGPASPTTCVTLTDTFPPSPPKSLAAVANAGRINLIWEPSDDADLAGYLVLRSELPDATLAPAHRKHDRRDALYRSRPSARV